MPRTPDTDRSTPLSRLVLSLMVASGIVANIASAESLDVSDWQTKSPSALLPGAANSVAFVNARQILESERAKNLDYAAKTKAAYENGQAVLPPGVETLAVSALLRPGTRVAPLHAFIATVSETNGAPISDAAAMKILATYPTVETKRDIRVAAVPDSLRFVGWSPSSRQELSHWLKGGFSPGLRPALADVVDSNADLAMALDLTDLVDPEAAAVRFQSNEAFPDAEATADLLLAVNRVSLTVDVEDAIDGTIELRTDRGSITADESAMLHRIFLSIVGDAGYELPEFVDFTASSEGGTVLLRGELSDESLGALVSLVIPPVSQRSYSATSRATAPETSEPQAAFEGISKRLDLLERRQQRATSALSVAGWCETTANQIATAADPLEDGPVAAFADRTVSRLGTMSRSLRGQSSAIAADDASITVQVDRDPGYGYVNVWGGVGWRNPSSKVRSNVQQVRERQAETVKAGLDDRREIWDAIRADQANTETLLNASN